MSYQGFLAFDLLRHKFSNFLIFDHKQLQVPLFEPAAATDSAGILFIKGVLRFIWCFVLVGAMRTPFVVELHIFGNPFLEFVFRPVGAPVQFFLLQRGEEGLHYTVIVGRAPFGEGLRHMAIAQKSSEGLGGILASPVGVEDQILAGIPFLKCLLESGGHQLGACPGRDFVGNHLSGIQIQDGADVVFLAAHCKLGAVSHPCRVGRTDVKLAIQNIGGSLELHPLFVIRLGSGAEAVKPQVMHDGEDGLFAGFVSPTLQYSKNFIGAKQPMVFLKDLFDSCRELLPSLSTKGRVLFAFHVSVERSPVYFQCIAEDPDRILIYKSFQLRELYRNWIGSRTIDRFQDLTDLLRPLLFFSRSLRALWVGIKSGDRFLYCFSHR